MMTEYNEIGSGSKTRHSIDEGEIIGIGGLIVMILVILLNAFGIG
jgi:hypothetical protein